MNTHSLWMRITALAGVTTLLASGAASGATRTTAARARQSTAAAPSDSAAAEARFDALPMAFEPNVGQTDARAKFVARGKGYAVFVEDGGVTLSLPSAARGASASAGDAVRMRFEGTNAGASVGDGLMPGTSAYLVGADEGAWRRDVPHYASVRREGLYDGIDAVFYGSERRLEYDFHVAPGADASRIRLRFEGQRSARVDDSGDLVLALSGGELRQRRAAVYQGDGAAKRAVSSRYAVSADGEVAIELGDYDRTKPLVVDPVLEFADFLGGTSSADDAFAGAVDASGALYVVGQTTSIDFPITPGAYQTTIATSGAFVTKIAANGQSLVYSTYLGGVSTVYPQSFGIAVDAAGEAVVTGSVNAGASFPTTSGAYDPSANGGSDAFVTKIAANGQSLVYSTLLGGSGNDDGDSVVVDGAGAAYVAGRTAPFGGTPFPTTAGAYDRTVRSLDGWIAKLDATGSTLVYSTYAGGAFEMTGIGVRSDGSVVACGNTNDPAFRTTPGAFDRVLGSGGADACVVRLSANGSTAVYATYLGGDDTETARALALDGSGAAYVVGTTQAANYPTTAGAYDVSLNGYADAFVTKLSADGASLVYSTFLGGGDPPTGLSGVDFANGVSVDGSGAAHVVGSTLSPSFPTTSGALDTTANGGQDGFYAKISANGASLVYSTVLGGAGDDYAYGVAVDASGATYVVGTEQSATFPFAAGLPTSAQRDGYNGYATKFSPSDALVYSSLLGGFTARDAFTLDAAESVAVDATGAIYVLGETLALNFPTTPGALDPILDRQDVFVTKLTADGSGLVYSTFLGGRGDEYAHGIKVDPSGNAYVAGSTSSPDFPATAGAYSVSFAGTYDGFVAKLAPNGGSLVYATYLGGTAGDDLYGLAIDASGAAYVGGFTYSTDFPTTPGSFGVAPLGNADAYLAKISPNGSSLVYSGLIGGGSSDVCYGVAVDASGAAYATGETSSFEFPTTTGAFQTSSLGTDAFVFKVKPNGASLVYSTFLGGSSLDTAHSIALDGAGAAYVAGVTSSSDFPTTAGGLPAGVAGEPGAFATKLDPTGESLGFSTYLVGPSGASTGYGVALAPGGDVYVTGRAVHSDFPLTPDAYDRVVDNDGDVFFVSLSTAGTIQYATFFGGTGTDIGAAIAVAPDGAAVIVGVTVSDETAPEGFGVHDHNDAFVAKLRRPTAGSTPGDTPGVVVGSTGAWFLRNSASGGGADTTFVYGGGGSLVPLSGDWDGDGDDTPGLYNPATGAFFLKNANAPGGADLVFTFGGGGAGVVPLSGDWNGDGVDTVGLYVAATGTFFLRNANASGPADLVFAFGGGGSGIVPIVGDWNGDGADTVGLYVASTGTFFLKNASAGGPADLAFAYGPTNLVPLAGDWNGDGIDTAGVYDPSTAAWFLKNANTPGGADVAFVYGPTGVTPLVGDWDGQ